MIRVNAINADLHRNLTEINRLNRDLHIQQIKTTAFAIGAVVGFVAMSAYKINRLNK